MKPHKAWLVRSEANSSEEPLRGALSEPESAGGRSGNASYEVEVTCSGAGGVVLETVRRRVRFRESIFPGSLLSRQLGDRGRGDRWQLRILGSVAWFCGSENRDNLLAIQRNLRIDERLMAAQGRGAGFICAALTFRSLLGAILPIIADGVWRLVRPWKAGKELAK
jgi:hypothetical protein